MDKKNLNKLFTVLIYILTIVLIGLIIYNTYLIFSKASISAPPPKNSIKVGPSSIEGYMLAVVTKLRI